MAPLFHKAVVVGYLYPETPCLIAACRPARRILRDRFYNLISDTFVALCRASPPQAWLQSSLSSLSPAPRRASHENPTNRRMWHHYGLKNSILAEGYRCYVASGSSAIFLKSSCSAQYIPCQKRNSRKERPRGSLLEEGADHCTQQNKMLWRHVDEVLLRSSELRVEAHVLHEVLKRQVQLLQLQICNAPHATLSLQRMQSYTRGTKVCRFSDKDVPRRIRLLLPLLAERPFREMLNADARKA